MSASPHETPPARREPDSPGTAAVALVAAGGVAWVVSAFLPWLGRGSGSVMSLRDVGDFLLEDRWSTIPRWVGFLAYVVPLCGGIALIASGLARATARRLVAILTVIAAIVVIVAAVVLVAKERAPALGFVLAALGTLVEVAGIVALRPTSLPSPGDGNK